MLFLVLIAVTVLLFPYAASALAKVNILWFTLESGNAKYIYAGDTLVRIVADVRGFVLAGHMLVQGTERKTWWERKLGIYWLGFPFIHKVKTFNIKRKKEHEELAGLPPEQWIRDLDDVTTDSLRAFFPRPFLLKETELGDRQTVNALVVAKFRAVNFYILGPELKWDFFPLLSSIVTAEVNDVLEAHASMDDFLKADKGTGPDGILKPLTDPNSNLNKALAARVGLIMIEATIPKWDPSDPATREAMNKKFIAEKAKEAEIIAAQAYSQQLGIRTDADASRVEKLAAARGKHVKAVLENLAAEGASPDELVKAASKVLRAESQPNLTSLVEEASAQAVVPVGGGGWK